MPDIIPKTWYSVYCLSFELKNSLKMCIFVRIFQKVIEKMNFEMTEEHKMIRDAARDFAQTELLPGVIERDENQSFPTEQIKKLGELGFLGMMVDPKYGGAGMDTISYVFAMEEISKVDASMFCCYVGK